MDAMGEFTWMDGWNLFLLLKWNGRYSLYGNMINWIIILKECIGIGIFYSGTMQLVLKV